MRVFCLKYKRGFGRDLPLPDTRNVILYQIASWKGRDSFGPTLTFNMNL